MSTIDHFKYMALLSELETKRDLKNPVTGLFQKYILYLINLVVVGIFEKRPDMLSC